MRTLFGEKIYSPSPSPSTIVKPNPLELCFSSGSITSRNYALSSSSGSYEQHGALTKARQDSHQQLEEHPSFQRHDIDWRDECSRYDADQKRSTHHGGSTLGGDAIQKGIPKVLIMGLSRSGKSSIQHVILKTKSAGETLYLEPTNQIVESATLESFIKLECVEVPSNLNFLSPSYPHETLFANAGSIVWVIDIQDENIHSISRLISTAIFLMTHYPRINFEIFVHKTDGLSDEYKSNTFRDVRQNIQDELVDRGYYDQPAAELRGRLAFHPTSIYDASIHEAMSKVVQALLPQLPAIEGLLTKLCTKCSMQKVYLFDTAMRISLATDASPTFLRDFEVCSEYVDMIVDAKGIYGWMQGDDADESVRESRRRARAATARERRRSARRNGALQSDSEDDYHDDDHAYGTEDGDESSADDYADGRSDDLDGPAPDAYADDDYSTIEPLTGESSITLPGSQNLYMLGREIGDHLSLICIMGQGSTPDRRVLIDYNITLAAEAIKEIFRIP